MVLLCMIVGFRNLLSRCSCLKDTPSHTSLHGYMRFPLSLFLEYFVKCSRY